MVDDMVSQYERTTYASYPAMDCSSVHVPPAIKLQERDVRRVLNEQNMVARV